jgi:hypothetical protein
MHMTNGNMERDSSNKREAGKTREVRGEVIDRSELVEFLKYIHGYADPPGVTEGKFVTLYYGWVAGLGRVFSTDPKSWTDEQITIPFDGHAGRLTLTPLLMDCGEIAWEAKDIKLVSALAWATNAYNLQVLEAGINGDVVAMDAGIFYLWSGYHAALASMWNQLMHAQNGNTELLPIILPILIREAPHLIASVIESLSPSKKTAEVAKAATGQLTGLPVANVLEGRSMNAVLKDIVSESGSRLMDQEGTAMLGGLISLVGTLLDQPQGEHPNEEKGACLLCDAIDGMGPYGDRLRAMGMMPEDQVSHNTDMHAANGNIAYGAAIAAKHNSFMHALNGNGDSRNTDSKLKAILEDAQKKTEAKTTQAEGEDGLDNSPLAMGKANEVSGSAQMEESAPAWIEEMSAKTLEITNVINYKYDYSNTNDFIVSWWNSIRNSFTIERNNVARTRSFQTGHRFLPSLQRNNVPASVAVPIFIPYAIGESGFREGPEIAQTEAFKTAMASLINSASQQVTGALRVNNNLTSGNIMQMMASLVSENLRNRIGTSVADILVRWFSYMSLSVPITRGTDSFIANTSISFPNPILAGWGPSAYPLSPVPIPRPLAAGSIMGMHCTLAQFVLVAGGYSPAPAGWEPETWGNTVAVVPVSMKMLNAGTKNITWSILHAEFPFGVLTYQAPLVDSGGNVLIANCGPVAVSNLWRMEGPRIRFLFVQVENNTTTVATTLIGGLPLLAANALIGGVPANLGTQFEAWMTTAWPLSLNYWKQMGDYFEGIINKKDWLDAIVFCAETSTRYAAPRIRTGVVLENAFWNDELMPNPFPVQAGTFTQPTSIEIASIYGCQTTPLGHIPIIQGTDSTAYRIGRHDPRIYVALWARFFSYTSTVPSRARSPFTIAAMLDQLSLTMAVSFDRIVERSGVPYRVMVGTGGLADPGGGDILFDNVQDFVLMYLNGINPDRTFKPLYPNRYGTPLSYTNLFPLADLNTPWLRIPKPLASIVYPDSYYCVDEVSQLEWPNYRSITLNIGGVGAKPWFILNYSIDDWMTDRMRKVLLGFIASGGYTQFNGTTTEMAIVDETNVESAFFSTGWTTPLPMVNSLFGNFTVIVQNQDTIEIPIISMPPLMTASGSDRLMNFGIDQHLPFFGPTEFGERLCIRRFGSAPINRNYVDSSRISATTLRSKLFRQKT